MATTGENLVFLFFFNAQYTSKAALWILCDVLLLVIVLLGISSVDLTAYILFLDDGST